ncbi:MAG: branched-chain amino acid aminotransferase [Acidimicrobiales bacterium]
MSTTTDPTTAPFGSVFGNHMAVATLAEDVYTYGGAAQPLENFSLHPATHAFHYGSTCFEGLKAHRQADGSVAIFRLDDHVARLRSSIGKLRMAIPDADLVRGMIIDVVSADLDHVPDSPGSLYLRPTFIGTAPTLGAAASPSATGMLYVIDSPVGDYFVGGIHPLTIYIEQTTPRTTPQFGSAKCGANYVMALGPTLDAKRDYQADQVLFATGGDVTETGAANFFLVDDKRIVTRQLDDSFLHGVTRMSVLQIAADLGYEVEERMVALDELRDWATHGEMFLSGTAAVVTPVGKVIVSGESITVGDGQPGAQTLRLREALTNVQTGSAPDTHGWLTHV